MSVDDVGGKLRREGGCCGMTATKSPYPVASVHVSDVVIRLKDTFDMN